MKTPIYVRAMTEEEQKRVKLGLRSKNGFEVRRSEIILASERKETARKIARRLYCDDETVRNVIKQFNTDGLDVLKAKSHRRHNIKSTITDKNIEQLKDILHQSPRNYGKETSLWTLNLLAEVSYSEKVSETQISGEAIRQALKRFGISWNRAKHWINSADPAYMLKKNNETG